MMLIASETITEPKSKKKLKLASADVVDLDQVSAQRQKARRRTRSLKLLKSRKSIGLVELTAQQTETGRINNVMEGNVVVLTANEINHPKTAMTEKIKTIKVGRTLVGVPKALSNSGKKSGAEVGKRLKNRTKKDAINLKVRVTQNKALHRSYISKLPPLPICRLRKKETVSMAMETRELKTKTPLARVVSQTIIVIANKAIMAMVARVNAVVQTITAKKVAEVMQTRKSSVARVPITLPLIPPIVKTRRKSN